MIGRVLSALICCSVVWSAELEASNLKRTSRPGRTSESQCTKDSDCAYWGRCLPSADEAKPDQSRFCQCFRSCPAHVPITCKRMKQCDSLHPEDLKRTNGRNVMCNRQDKVCNCPSSEKESCIKKDLRVDLRPVPNDTPYQGEKLQLRCCLDTDPRGHVESVELFHNQTIKLKPKHTPFDLGLNGTDRTYWYIEICWYYDIPQAHFTDSGNYTCVVKSNVLEKPIKNNLPVQVRGSAGFKLKATIEQDKSIYRNDTPITVNFKEVKAINSSAIFASWKTEPDNIPVNLRVLLSSDQTNVILQKTSFMAQEITITDLQPYTYYTITVSTAVTSRENVSAERKNHVRTDESAPGPPKLLEMGIEDKINRDKCEISWQPPELPNGRITHYEVKMFGEIRLIPENANSISSKHKPSSINCPDLDFVEAEDFITCEFHSLLPNRNYSAQVVAVNSAGKSDPTYFETMCATNYGPPDSVKATKIEEYDQSHNHSVLQIVFGEKPDEINGPIACYYVAVVPLPHNVSVSVLPNPAQLDIESPESTFESNLQMRPKARHAYIAESFKKLPERSLIGDGVTFSGGEPCPVWFLSRYEPTDKALKPGYKYTGFLIIRVDLDKNLLELDQHKERRGRRKKRQTYLQPRYGYSGYFEAVLLGGSELVDSPSGSWHVVSIVLIILLLVVLLIVATGVLFILHRKGLLKHWLCFEKNKVPERGSFTELNKRHRDFQPIPVADLPEEYILRHRDSDFLFGMEFESLPNYSNFDTTASDLKDNSRKNRYNDIKAYDVTRVKLALENGDPATDYINANFINGYKGRKKFIAAQGPLVDTVVDFWRMCWEHRVEIIVMVTNLHEKYRAQCTKYWPDNDTVVYGYLEVKPKEASYFADYAVRTFDIKKYQGDDHIYDSVGPDVDGEGCAQTSSNSPSQVQSEVRTIVQYHYTGWHDYRAPECTTGLLRFLMRLRKLDPFQSSPVVVHCSAGVGRTGTFIAIDGVLDQCQEEGKADITGFVSQLRRQRNFMVQSLEQYVFVYKALAEWFTFGDTDIEVDKIHDHVKRLKEIQKEQPTHRYNGLSPRIGRAHAERSATKMFMEYKKLERTLENGRTSDFAKKDGNERKNRSSIVVPFDRNRVILAPVLGQVDASYINASVIRGNFYPYYLAQDPLNDETCYDFWRMISEQNATCIVTLSNEEQFSNDEKFWPDESRRTKTFGKTPEITVQLAAEDENSVFLTRKINFSSSKKFQEKSLREVVQFVYRDWPLNNDQSNNVPRSTSTLLELIGRVLQRQSYLLDSAGPIIVHCRDGSTRSGLYCAVSLLLERLKQESRVDVFQTAKSLQAQRPMMLNSLEQYAFAYQAVLDYLESFL